MQFYFNGLKKDALPDAVADIHDDLVSLAKMSADLATQCSKLNDTTAAAKMRDVDALMTGALQILEEFF